MPSVGPSILAFCLYMVLVPGESRGTQCLLVTVHSGKNWRANGQGQTTGQGVHNTDLKAKVGVGKTFTAA